MTTPSHEPARMHTCVSVAAPSAPACRWILGTGREWTGGRWRGLAVLLALGCMAMPAAAAQEESQAEPMTWTTSCDYSVLPGARLKKRTALRDAALVSGSVSLGQYSRYQAMQPVLADAYYSNSTQLIDEIADGERAYQIGKKLSEFVSLAGTASSVAKWLNNKDMILAKMTDVMFGGRGLYPKAYMTALAKEAGLDLSSKVWVETVSVALSVYKDGLDQGVIPPEYGDLYSALTSLDPSSPGYEEHVQGLLSGPQGQLLGTIIAGLANEAASITLEVGQDLVNTILGRAASGNVPWFYIASKTISIIGTVTAIAITEVADLQTQQKNAALYFLSYYIGGYGGDRVAFECALGKAPGKDWGLRDAFYNFLLSNDEYGRPYLDTFPLLRAGPKTLNTDYFSSAYWILVEYMKKNSVFALRRSTPGKYAIADELAGSVRTSLSMLDELNVLVTVDPYLAPSAKYGPGHACVLSHRGPRITNGLTVDVARSTFVGGNPYEFKAGYASTFLNVDASTSRISYSEQLTMLCGMSGGEEYTYSYGLNDSIATPEGYFHFTAPPALSANSERPDSRFQVTIQTPRIDAFFTGVDGQTVDFSKYRARLWLEEEKSPGNFVVIAEKEVGVGTGAGPGAYQLRADTLSLEYDQYTDFFVKHTSTRNFRLRARVDNAPFLTSDGYTIELTHAFAPVHADDVVMGWEQDAYQLFVEDTQIAAWDASEGSITLKPQGDFMFCFGHPYDGSQGELESYALDMRVEIDGIWSDFSMTSRPLNPHEFRPWTGCAIFPVPWASYLPEYARFKLERILTRTTGYQLVQSIPVVPALVQVIGSEPVIPNAPRFDVLNDTGITWSAPQANTLSGFCNPADPAGQDCHYGRDALAAAGQLQKVGGGHGGFDFTKISNSGDELPASALLGSGANDWACTRDNVTGLIWEVKVNDTAHMRHRGHGYAWYNPSSPDGNVGAVGNASSCSNTLGGQSCNTQNYVQAVNTNGLCGAHDWRMPTARELENIKHYGRRDPAIDVDYLAIISNYSVWSDSTVAENSSMAWMFMFETGMSGRYGKLSPYGAWVVRSGK